MDAVKERRPVVVNTAGYVTIALAAEKTGLTQKAIRCKIDRGYWVEGKQYKRGPDGRLYVNIREYEKWIEGT